jgi:hypothetical protein
MLLHLLLEKLYGHRSDLEFMMSVHQTHYPENPKKLSDQYASCLCNIQAYELMLQQKNSGIVPGKMS